MPPAELPDSSDGKYYFGALFGDLDFYFFSGENTTEVLGQYTTLTGRSPMPPKYVFGLHQGAYGYFDRQLLEDAVNAYRPRAFPATACTSTSTSRTTIAHHPQRDEISQCCKHDGWSACQRLQVLNEYYAIVDRKCVG